MPLLTPDVIRQQVKSINYGAVRKENYLEIALKIHPQMGIDSTSVPPNYADLRLQKREALRPYFQLTQQPCQTEDWLDMVIACVVLWQYNAALLREIPQLKPISKT